MVSGVAPEVLPARLVFFRVAVPIEQPGRHTRLPNSRTRALMAATMPRGWTRPLADRLHELAEGRSWELISRIASRKAGAKITIAQVRNLMAAPSTLNPVVVEGVRRAVGMSGAEAARLQREGENG